MDNSIMFTGDFQVDFDTGELMTLEDLRYSWRERKLQTVRLAKLYQMAGFDEYAQRARTCATWLQYGVTSAGVKNLMAANFCQLRLCPMCSARRAKKAAFRLSHVLDAAEAAAPDTKFLFLTLTIRNVGGEDLGEALSQLTSAWYRLQDCRQVERSIRGWFRAVEITRHDKGYHPHIHAVLAVAPSYFSRSGPEYITHERWVRLWQRALRVDYKPSVRIQVAKAKDDMAAGKAAALEAAKYAVKDADYIDPQLNDEEAAEILTDYTHALYKRRLTAFGGSLKAAAQQLDAEELEDGDLVHIDDTLRDDVAEMIEEYNWSFGAADYILSNRRSNPLRELMEYVK